MRKIIAGIMAFCMAGSIFPVYNSNISGYSYTWGKNNSLIPPKQVEHFTKENVLKIANTPRAHTDVIVYKKDLVNKTKSV